jgi:hypothetical protein
MSVRKTAIIAICLGMTAVAVRCIVSSWEKDPSPQERAAAAQGGETGNPIAPASSQEKLPGKSKGRPPSPKLSKEETLALMGTILPGPTLFPEQTVSDRVDAINRRLNEAGISPDELRVEMHASTVPYAEVKFEALGVRDASIADLFKYTVVDTRLHFKVRKGVVEFFPVFYSDPTSLDPESPRPPPDIETEPF